MSKKIQLIKYNITPNERSWGITYKTEAWDEYGAYSCVYENSEILAMEYILEWWKKSKEREESNKLLSKAIIECNKIDKETGILTGNRDGLD